MPIVTNTQPGNFIIPGTYIVETPQPPPQQLGPNTSLLAIVGTANYGAVNTPTSVSLSSVLANFGNDSTLPYSVLDAINDGASPETSQFLVNRVSDGTDTKASVTITDSTGFAFGTLTISGTAGASQTITATLQNGSNPAVTTAAYSIVQGTDTPTTIAAALVSLINATGAVLGANAFVQPATSSAGVITITALTQGTAGNSITVLGTVTGSGTTVTPTNATAFASGAAPGTIGTLSALYTGTLPNSTTVGTATLPATISGYRLDLSAGTTSAGPVYTLTLFFPQQSNEVFTGIIAYATAGGAYNGATFKANLAAAVNTGSTAHAPSQFWTFSSGGSTATPLAATYRGASGGTNGSAGVTLGTLIGVDGTTGRTGMYALRKMISAGQFFIAGLGDCTAAQTLATFAQQENSIAGIDLGPSGTTPSTAVATMVANNVNSRFLVASMEWDNYRDTFTGLVGLHSPTSTTMGTIASLDPWESPLNKPTGGKKGIVSTEWTVGQFPDETLLQTNNICYIKRYAGNFVLFNDNCSDGTPIADTRMLNYIAQQLILIGAPFLGQDQSLAANDGTRADYFGAIKSFLNGLLDPTGRNPKINAFKIDQSGNTNTTIQGGFLIGRTSVTTLRGIRVIMNILQVGSQVVIQQ